MTWLFLPWRIACGVYIRVINLFFIEGVFLKFFRLELLLIRFLPSILNNLLIYIYQYVYIWMLNTFLESIMSCGEISVKMKAFRIWKLKYLGLVKGMSMYVRLIADTWLEVKTKTTVKNSFSIKNYIFSKQQSCFYDHKAPKAF